MNDEQFRGKSLVITFSGLWCDICRVELPIIERVAGQYRSDRNLVFITVTSGRSVREMKEWATRSGFSLPIAIGDDYFKLAGIVAVPTTWVVSSDGIKMFEISGMAPNFEKLLRSRIDYARAGLYNRYSIEEKHRGMRPSYMGRSAVRASNLHGASLIWQMSRVAASADASERFRQPAPR